MKTKIGLVGAALVALVASLVVAIQPAQAAVGIRVSGGRLLEGNGTQLVLRGVNAAHVWFPGQTSSSFAAIKAAGANSVRVVLSGGRWTPVNNAADVTNVINMCKANRLICLLENHDTTGFGEQGGSVSLDAAVNYWLSVQSALTGQENYVILNIGNEPFGNNAVSPNWTQATTSAIQRLRNAGLQHTIMADAPNWGQDWQFMMRDTAPSVLAADTSGNTIFSIHMYGVFDTAAEVNAYIDSFTSRNLAICICEFGNMHSDGDPHEDAIMAKARTANIGMMGWSWSGNGGGVEYLDMVQNNNGVFNASVRSGWGNRYITGTDGLSTTSREATIFGGGNPGDTQAPTTPGTPTASGITATSVNLNWTASSDNVGVTGYDILRAPGASGGTFAVVGTSTTTSFTNTGLTANTTYRYQARARDAAGNTSAASSAVTVTTTGGGGGDTQAPTTPGTPTASGITATSVNLNWTASSDNVGVTGYDILRAPGASGGTFAVVGTSTTTSFTNTGLTANTTYRYQARARDAAGNTSAASGAVAVTTTTGGGTGGCTATYTIGNQWPGGFGASVTVTNGSTASTSWTVSWTFANGQGITQLWNGVDTPSGASHSVRNMSYNGNLGPNASTSFGFNGSWTGTNSIPALTCTRA